MRRNRFEQKTRSQDRIYMWLICILASFVFIASVTMGGIVVKGAADLAKNPNMTVPSDSEGNGENAGAEGASNSEEAETEEEEEELTFIRHASASSELPQDGDVTYEAKNVNDGNLRTGWSEDEYGLGIGAWVEVSFDKRITGALRIHNGYQKTEDLYYANSRVCDAVIEFINGQKYEFAFYDETGPQVIVFPDLGKVNGFRLTVESAYEGYSWDDTTITEIAIADADRLDASKETIIYATPID